MSNPTDLIINDKYKDDIFKKYILYNPPNYLDNKLVDQLFPNTAICRDTGYLCKITENRSRQYNRTIFMDNDKYKNNHLEKK